MFRGIWKLKKEEEKKEDEKAAAGEAEVGAEGAVDPGETAEPGCDGGAGEAATSGETEESAEEKPSEPDWKTLYALTLADFDNYKKRAARDREETYRYAEGDILKDVLPAVDNLQLALDSAKDKADDPFVKGVRLVYDTLLASLRNHGAEPFDSVGKDLDTEKMEAIAHLPSADVEEGKVSVESKRGWMLRDKVLRPAQVVVSSGRPEMTGEAEKPDVADLADADGAKETPEGGDGR